MSSAPSARASRDLPSGRVAPAKEHQRTALGFGSWPPRRHLRPYLCHLGGARLDRAPARSRPSVRRLARLGGGGCVHRRGRQRHPQQPRGPVRVVRAAELRRAPRVRRRLEDRPRGPPPGGTCSRTGGSRAGRCPAAGARSPTLEGPSTSSRRTLSASGTCGGRLTGSGAGPRSTPRAAAGRDWCSASPCFPVPPPGHRVVLLDRGAAHAESGACRHGPLQPGQLP